MRAGRSQRVAVVCGTGLVAVALAVYGLELACGGRFFGSDSLSLIGGWWHGAIVVSGYGGPRDDHNARDCAAFLPELLGEHIPTWPRIGRMPEVADVGVSRVVCVEFPVWIPLALGLALLIRPIWLRFHVPPRHCRCGYDLTGNTSGRCPECGQAVARENLGAAEAGSHRKGRVGEDRAEGRRAERT